jgi:uncharacterized protein YkwD
MRQSLSVLLILTTIIISSLSPSTANARSSDVPGLSTASEVITIVNQLRASNGLAPYRSNAILMGIAQEHAEYMAAIGVSNVHTDAQGLRPFQRALAAGYLVAGDLSLGGFFAENVAGGIGMSAADVVNVWMGDKPHQDTMLSPNLADIGVGVAVVGDTYYYCLDAGLSTGGSPVSYTPPPPLYTSAPVRIPNTPEPDGAIKYTVQQSDTLLAIAISYGVSLTDLYNLNGLTEKSVIYPGQTIIIRAGFTPTPTLPTGTPTELPTITPWPTPSSTATLTPIPPTPTPSPGLPISAARGAVIVIAAAALLISGGIALLGRRKK